MSKSQMICIDLVAIAVMFGVMVLAANGFAHYWELFQLVAVVWVAARISIWWLRRQREARKEAE